jgi:hypothetical protein
MVARHFDGTDKYSGGALADINSGSLSVCAILRTAGGTNKTVVGRYNTADANRGWQLWTQNTGVGHFRVTGNAIADVSVSIPGLNNWVVMCGSGNSAGNIEFWNNNTASTTTAYPAGSTSAGAKELWIGADDGTAGWQGDLAAVWIWSTTRRTSAEVLSIQKKLMGISNTRGESYSAATYTSGGAQCCWIGGKLECFSQNHPMLGCQIPPGFTGAGLGGSGYFAHPAVTNSLLQSDNLTATWNISSGPTVSTTATNSPYRDGRAVSMLADTSAVSYQYTYQAIDITALNAGDKVRCQVYLREDPAHPGGHFGLIAREQTGGVQGDTITDNITLTSSWAYYSVEITIADTANTFIYLFITPYWVAEGVGGVNYGMMAGAQCFKSIAYPVPIVIPTTTAAASGGGDNYRFAVNTPIVTGGAVVGGLKLSANWTPFYADNLSAARIMTLDDGTVNQRLFVDIGAAEKFGWTTTPGGNDILSAAQTLAAGTAWRLLFGGNYASDVYSLLGNGASLGTSTTARSSPAGITTFRIGVDSAGTGQCPGGCLIKNVTISK